MFAKLRKGFLLIFIALSVLLGVWVCVENTSPVTLTLFGYSLSPQPLGLFVVAAFVAGIICGLLGNLLAVSWLLFKLKSLQKRLNTMQYSGSTGGR